MTPELSAKIAKAKKAGYSDGEIASYLGQDSTLAPKIAQAKSAGYDDASIIGFLAKPQGYDKARARLAVSDAVKDKTSLGGLGNWEDQVTRSLGVRDEIEGG